MAVPQVFTATVNGRPKVVVLNVYITPYDMKYGCHKTVRLNRRNSSGRKDEFNLEIDLPRDAVEGTIFTFEKMGDYLDNGDYQTINVMINAADDYNPPTDFNMDFNATGLPVYGSAASHRNNYYENLQSPPMQQQPPHTQRTPRPDYYNNSPAFNMPQYNNGIPMPFTQNGNQNTPFQQLKVNKKGDFDITYLPNGDVAVQLRIEFCDLGVSRSDFRKILTDGTMLEIKHSNMNVVGIPEYKPNFFTPVKGSMLSGNLHLLIVSDLNGGPDFSKLCCT